MKECTGCRKEKPDDDFSWKNKAKGRRQTRCKECCSAYGKEWYKDNSVVHRASVVLSKQLRRESLLAWVNEMKTSLCCCRCGESDPVCLDFHHRDATEKEIGVSEAIYVAGWGLQKLQEEIAKCDVLCANCHRKAHAELRLIRCG